MSFFDGLKSLAKDAYGDMVRKAEIIKDGEAEAEMLDDYELKWKLQDFKERRGRLSPTDRLKVHGYIRVARDRGIID